MRVNTATFAFSSNCADGNEMVLELSGCPKQVVIRIHESTTTTSTPASDSEIAQCESTVSQHQQSCEPNDTICNWQNQQQMNGCSAPDVSTDENYFNLSPRK